MRFFDCPRACTRNNNQAKREEEEEEEKKEKKKKKQSRKPSAEKKRRQGLKNGRRRGGRGEKERERKTLDVCTEEEENICSGFIGWRKTRELAGFSWGEGESALYAAVKATTSPIFTKRARFQNPLIAFRDCHIIKREIVDSCDSTRLFPIPVCANSIWDDYWKMSICLGDINSVYFCVDGD